MLSGILWNDDDLATLQAELAALLEGASPQMRDKLASIVKQCAPDLTERFYTVMMAQSRAQLFLDHDVVNERLRASLKVWLTDLFRSPGGDTRQLLGRQLEIGNVHARIQVPVSLVMRGFRELRQGIYLEIRHARLPREDLVEAVRFSSLLLDLALSAMTAAYVGSSERATRADEALRLFSIGQDVAAERERQRAALAEWAQTVFFAVQIPDEGADKLSLSHSDFGLWFFHRASLLFGRSTEYSSIVETVERIDTILGRLPTVDDAAERQAMLREIKKGVERIGSLLSMLFDRFMEAGGARDPLTRLLSRRFLTTAVSREIAIQKASRRPFSVIMFEIGDFARVRSRFDEAGADVVIQQTAAILFNAARSSDSVFSMGRETFLMIRVRTGAAEAQAFAKALADRYAATHFEVNGQVLYDNSLKVGVVEYDGHPDPRYLISRAEQALQQAKAGAPA